MMRIVLPLLATATLVVPQLAGAVCNYPPQVDVPEGKTASEAEMKAANAAVKDYMAAVESYLACLDDEEKSLGDTVTEDQKRVHTEKHNAAVDALNAVAGRYNEQVQAYKKASGK